MEEEFTRLWITLLFLRKKCRETKKKLRFGCGLFLAFFTGIV